ncbi:MAG: N-acetylmuramoyl-L-alanine amidase, partial [Clostridia bacterium]|nr:N-acetylmuramoyl-L-alanine amidase [Clostridia bacterium]
MFRNWHFSLKYCICSCLIFLVVIGLGWESASKGFTSPLLSVSGGESLPLVIIDAGHGGEDCGAIGVNGVYEKDINLAISFALGDWLSSVGYPVLFTRVEDKLLYTEEQNIKGQRKAYDLRNRLEIAQKHPGSIFVSIHMNSFSDGQYSGLQVWHNGGELSKSVAEGIQSTVRELLQKGNTRKVKTA